MEVIRVGTLMGLVSFLAKEEARAFFFSAMGRQPRRAAICEREEGPHQKPTTLAP